MKKFKLVKYWFDTQYKKLRYATVFDTDYPTKEQAKSVATTYLESEEDYFPLVPLYAVAEETTTGNHTEIGMEFLTKEPSPDIKKLITDFTTTTNINLNFI